MIDGASWRNGTELRTDLRAAVAPGHDRGRRSAIPDLGGKRRRDTPVELRRVGELAGDVAEFLVSRGVQRGDAVHVALSNSPAFVAVWLAVTVLGATLVPSDPEASARELADCMRRTRAVTGVGSARRADRYREAAAAQRSLHVTLVDEETRCCRRSAPADPAAGRCPRRRPGPASGWPSCSRPEPPASRRAWPFPVRRPARRCPEGLRGERVHRRSGKRPRRASGRLRGGRGRRARPCQGRGPRGVCGAARDRVRRPGRGADRLVRGPAEPAKRPREIRFVPELPRTSVGKIRKFLLAEGRPRP
jgi:hypothetical protein